MPEPLRKSAELRAELRNTAERMGEILEEPRGEHGGLDSEQEQEWNRLHEAQTDLEERIQAIESEEQKHQERLAAHAEVQKRLKESKPKVGATDTEIVDRDAGSEEEQRAADEKYERAFDAYLRYGPAAMTPEAQATLATRMGSARSLDLPEEVRAMGVASDTAGGFFVPEGFLNRIVEARKNFGGMRRARTTVIPTSSGQDLPIPTDDDTSNTGAILPENTTDSTQDVAIGQVVLHAYVYTSKIVKVSRQLLQDSAFDIPGYLSRKLATRIGRITNTHFTTGDGAAKPWGVTQQAVSAATAASETDVTIDELLDLKHAVDPDYREMAEWMFNDSTLKLLKKKKDGEGRPLWQSGIAIGEPNSIDGDPYVVNQDMPTLASSVKGIAYGDFMNYYIRDVLGVQLLRLDERYADALQVGFLAFSRHDGVLVDAGQNPVQVITQAA